MPIRQVLIIWTNLIKNTGNKKPSSFFSVSKFILFFTRISNGIVHIKKKFIPYIPLDTITLHVTYQLMLPIAHQDFLRCVSVPFYRIFVGYQMKLFLYYVDILNLMHMSLPFNYPSRYWCNFVYQFWKDIYSNICNNIQPQSMINNFLKLTNTALLIFVWINGSFDRNISSNPALWIENIEWRIEYIIIPIIIKHIFF